MKIKVVFDDAKAQKYFKCFDKLTFTNDKLTTS